ncbi:MAG: NAD(P)H-binding protein [Deltaproteobacteria bacterium]|nr:NAD(P)H-binding protein [Deltaproteobacteria bacterium]
MPRFVLTGANGRIGQNLVARAAGARALVRSQRAADSLAGLGADVRVLDVRDVDALARAAEGCEAWIHLVGILKETRSAKYVDAHERSCEAVARAAERAGVRRIVCLSILGARPDSANACLASKGRADALLLGGRAPATVLRVPMVLGPGEIAAFALRAQARARVAFMVRGGATREQPIDTRDIVSALLLGAADSSDGHVALDLAGPESLTHRELVVRIARVLGKPAPAVVPIPAALAFGAAALLERLAEPPVTRAMLGVLEHDDQIDPRPAAQRLGLTLTPLADTLSHTFAPENRAA